MLVTLLAPEVFLAKALADFWAAKRSVARVRTLRDKAGKLLPESKVANWTISHAYYAEMGGFALRTSTPRESGEGHKLQRLRSEDIFELRELGCISRLPSITKDQIMDKGKGDFIVKLTAILQVFWMLIQVIVRAARGLPISRLEVTACAFAACASVTYVLWWNKPQAVTACTKITIEARETWALAQFGTSWTFDKGRLPYKSIFEAFVPLSDSKAYTTEDMPISNDALPAETIATRGLSGSITLGLALGCMLLGAIHCAAWNFYLPTRTEQLLWRCFSLVSCFLILTYFLLRNLLRLVFDIPWYIPWLSFLAEDPILDVLAGVCNIIYIACRLFLLFESIWSLFHLPPRAFITTLASNIPHV